MPITAVVGINWGDEGKGRIVDLLACDCDYVVRCQGGNNAGHTVVNDYGKFALNLIPSGIFQRDTVNVLGAGMVIDIEHLVGEMDTLRSKGIPVTPQNLRISDRAIICFPFHRDQDQLEEERLAGKKYGSTRRGIAPVYGDKYLKKGIQVGELFHHVYLAERVRDIVEWKNKLLTGVYDAPPCEYSAIMSWLSHYGEKIKPFVADVSAILEQAASQNKNILLEAQLGALRDIDYGIYPYTSSSSPLAVYALLGAGLFNSRIDRIVGIVKAYSTCVGEGPFVTEIVDEAGDRLREAGNEYGAATGRPRRVGHLDLVATKYGCRLQAPTDISLTKLDTLSGLKTLRVCVEYEVDGRMTKEFPFTPLLYSAKPVYKDLPGWDEDISAITEYSALPASAKNYIQFIEAELGKPITSVSVGAYRNQIIWRQKK